MIRKRTRRVFTAAFKMEAVRRMEEQRALKVPMAEIARDLNVRGERLHAWARQLRERAGLAPTDVFPGEGKLPSAEEELRQLRRELEVSRQETAFLKKAAVSSTGRCNTSGEYSTGSEKAKGFAWPRVQLERDHVQIRLRVRREVGPSREILA